MFVQVMQGKVADQERLQRQIDAWRQEVKPGAIGFLGSTSGNTPDGTAVVIARFESGESARANSERPEQSAWWEQTASAFDGDVTFIDCPQVDLIHGGGSDSAGFVQVMQGRAADREKMRSAGQAMEDELHSSRPDVLGGLVGWHGDRDFVQVIYFSSEAEARANEAKMGEGSGAEEWAALLDGPITFLDLSEPVFD